ncbi:hypothetical protein GY31_16735 [Lysinibacillus sphaericus]|nr:hypothetical protein GY31_16735 [Lysinibacillus sphaericus]
MDNKYELLGILCIIIPILSTIYILLNSDILVPKGYNLEIYGYVISRNLMIIFLLYLLSKLGYFLYSQLKQD